MSNHRKSGGGSFPHPLRWIGQCFAWHVLLQYIATEHLVHFFKPPGTPDSGAKHSKLKQWLTIGSTKCSKSKPTSVSCKQVVSWGSAWGSLGLTSLSTSGAFPHSKLGRGTLSFVGWMVGEGSLKIFCVGFFVLQFTNLALSRFRVDGDFFFHFLSFPEEPVTTCVTHGGGSASELGWPDRGVLSTWLVLGRSILTAWDLDLVHVTSRKIFPLACLIFHTGCSKLCTCSASKTLVSSCSSPETVGCIDSILFLVFSQSELT